MAAAKTSARRWLARSLCVAGLPAMGLAAAGCAPPAEIEVRLDNVVMESVSTSSAGVHVARFRSKLVMLSSGLKSDAATRLYLIDFDIDQKFNFTPPDAALESSNIPFPITLYPQTTVGVDLVFTLTQSAASWCALPPFLVGAAVYDEHTDTIHFGTSPGSVQGGAGVCP